MTRTVILRLAVGLTLLLAADTTPAFHDGGTANCNGCHISHTNELGIDEVMLIAESPSDVCLVCHASGAGNVLGTDPLAPPRERGAGNFVFLLEDNLNDAPEGAMNPIPGEAAGHNIVAIGHGLLADTRNPVAPGGSFPASQLGCTSCHDPHGSTSFRLLYGAGGVQGGLATFANSAPVARGIGLGGAESDSHHNAYQSGMSQWCANCHGLYHDSGLTGFEHPSTENIGAEISTQYNRYDGDDNPTGASAMTSYLAAVPFEDPNPVGTGSRSGPTSTSRVMCLTCHRAHASSAPSAGRWDFNVSLLRDDGAVSQSFPIPDPYNSPNQGSLCTKCHSTEPSTLDGSSNRTRTDDRVKSSDPQLLRRVPR